MINVSRRFFCFGAAATLVVPPPKSFFIVKPPPLIAIPAKPFDLPTQEMLSLLKKLEEKVIEVTALPRWVVCDNAWYDALVASSPASRRETLRRTRLAASDHAGDLTRRIALRS